MKHFVLVLKNEKVRSYRLISLLLFTINFLCILYITYLKGFTKWGPLIIAAAGMIAGFSSFYQQKKNERIRFAGAFLLFVVAWISIGYFLPAVINVIFPCLSFVTMQVPVVTVNEAEILYPSFPKKKIVWNELNNLIIKDGLLTIDFKNNKVIQQYISETSADVNEKEFNQFCQQQLNK
jgi:hypothetical protein